MTPTLLILAAGSGTRYGGLKQLDALGPNGEAIMEYSIHDALNAGFGKVVIVIREEFRKEFDDKITSRWKNKIKIDFVYQKINLSFEGLPALQREKPWGPVHAMLCAKSIIQEPFVIVNADDFYGKDAFVKMGKFLREGCTPHHYVMMGYVLENTLSEHGSVSRGICKVDEKGFLINVQEMKEVKKQGDEMIGLFNGEKRTLQPEAFVSMNCWGFHPDFFNKTEKVFKEFVGKNLKNPKAEMVLPDVVDVLLKSGNVRVSVLPCNEKWFGVTHREDREHVVKQLRQLSGE